MKLINFLAYIIIGFVTIFTYSHVMADDAVLDISKILAIVPVKSGNIDKNVYSQFDRLVPELKKISKNKIVKLECRYSGQPDREQDVENAYNMAARIEKYLRVRHKLDLDLWVSIDIKPKSEKTVPVLTIAVFSDDIKKLDAVKIDPAKKQ